MAELERSAVVTEWITVRILVGSEIEYGFLLLLVAWASVLFASSEGYRCDWHGPAKSPMSAFFFPAGYENRHMDPDPDWLFVIIW